MNMRHGFPAAAFILCCTLAVAASEPPFWPCESDDGEPFGQLTDEDAETLVSLASEHGIQLVPTIEKVYTGDKEALSTILRLSTVLETLDMPTRVYGKMVYSTFLNLGEAKGTDLFISVLLSEEPSVRQRIRDFLWYPLFCVPEPQRATTADLLRTEFPLLWPQEFVFGEGDRLFSNRPNNGLQPSDPSVTLPAEQAPRQPAGG